MIQRTSLFVVLFPISVSILVGLQKFCIRRTFEHVCFCLILHLFFGPDSHKFLFVSYAIDVLNDRVIVALGCPSHQGAFSSKWYYTVADEVGHNIVMQKAATKVQSGYQKVASVKSACARSSFHGGGRIITALVASNLLILPQCHNQMALVSYIFLINFHTVTPPRALDAATWMLNNSLKAPYYNGGEISLRLTFFRSSDCYT